MSLQSAILGFLSFKPLSGYDLKKAFDRSIQHFWPANQSQIYRTLAQLKAQGLVAQEVIEREERLDKKVYHITDAGRTELHRWLSTPLPPQGTREPFLIQVYFGGKLSDDELIALVEREIGTSQESLAAYASIYNEYAARIGSHQDPRALFLSLLTLEYGILAQQAQSQWLETVRQRVQSGNYKLAEFPHLMERGTQQEHE